MARISVLLLRLSVIACAVAMLLICARAVHAQGVGGTFQAVPSATSSPNPVSSTQPSQAMMQQSSPPAGISSGVASQPATLYDAQSGPSAPMYGAPAPAYASPQPTLYSAQSDTAAPAQGYYSTQIVPIPSGPQYGPQPMPQYTPQSQPQYAAPLAQSMPQYAPQPQPQPQYAAPTNQPTPQSYVPVGQPGPAPYSPGSLYGIPQRLLASSPNAAAPGEGGYTLGLGDRVHITVYDEPDMTGDYQVDGNGAIRLPLIGSLRAGGYTASGLEAEIHNALSPGYIKNPRINVAIISYRPIYVVGAVTKPGQYAYVNDMTLLNAVALAGGFTEQAVESTVYVRHEGEAEEQSAPTAIPLLIRPGDTVRVKTTVFWDAMNMFSPLAGPLAIGAAAVH